MMVTYREEQKQLTSFLTGVCAVIGGIFTLASLTDTYAFEIPLLTPQCMRRLLYSAEKALKKKIELGKHS